MTRVRYASTALVGAVSVAILGARQQPFRADTHTVSIYATVVDPNNRLVTDLTKDDFEVYDDGVKQNVTLFDNQVQPITIVIMLDRSGSMIENFDLVSRGAEHFVGQLLPNDRARLGSFSNRIQIDPEEFTSDHQVLARILHDDLQDAGATPLWNATSVAMTALAHESGRRVVLLFTDGYDSPEKPNGNIAFAEVHRRAQVEEIMVYGIGLSDPCAPSADSAFSNDGLKLFQRRGGSGGQGRGGPGRGGVRIPGIGGRRPVPIPLPPIGDGHIGRPPSRPGEPPKDPVGRNEPTGRYPCARTKPDPDLRTLASDGGGGYFELRASDDLNATFARVADELHHQYLLAFPVGKRDGRVHTVDVRVGRDALKVRARKSYLAPGSSSH